MGVRAWYVPLWCAVLLNGTCCRLWSGLLESSAGMLFSGQWGNLADSGLVGQESRTENGGFGRKRGRK